MKKSNILIVIFVLVILNVSSLFSQGKQTALSPAAEKLKSWVTYLASDELEGRFSGTAGNAKAAEFVLNNFKTAGLQPVAGKYTQEFPFLSAIKTGDKNDMEFQVIVEKIGIPREMLKPTKRKWAIGADWYPIRFSENGTVASELVFAGYGITSKEIKYDDYANIDAKGKIVIILTDSAEGKPKISDFLAYSDLRYKTTNAREHGAKGIIFVKTQSDSQNVFYKLKVDRHYKNSGLICIQANRTALAKLFPKERPLLDLERKIDKERQPQSFAFSPDTKVSITVDLIEEKKDISNIIGMVPGTDAALKNEYVIVGAHFDHLGWGYENSSYKGKEPQIHHGADDNSSGTSDLIELANRIAQKPLSRTVVFIAFNAEEEGTLGSSFYTKNPLLPLENTVFMLNFDMVGRLKDNKINIFGTGSSSRFSSTVDSIAAIDSVIAVKTNEAFSPSDNSSFYAKGIPAMMLFTGVHTDYHKPSDDVDKINFNGMVEVADFSEHILRAIGNNSRKPDLIKEIHSNSSEPIPAEQRRDVWFGIVPNFEGNPKGCAINGASSGSPAQKAGLKANDIITKFDTKTIKNIQDLTYAIREHKPGDVVKVQFIREGKEMEVEVKLMKKE